MNGGNVRDTLLRDLCVFDDETNPSGSKRDIIWAPTVLDQVFDQLSPDHKNLRQILEDLRREVIEGTLGSVTFPVTSVNGQGGDVQLRPEDIGLGNVDNTRDADKPLSVPQRNMIFQILKDYDFNVDLSSLEEHLLNTNNPHSVKVEDLNKDGSLERYIGSLITKHNYATQDNIHMDIRRSLSNLWVITDQRDKLYTERLDELLIMLRNHFTDSASHMELFDKKEDTEHKALSMMDEEKVDHLHYPSTRAVAEYVGNEIADFRKSIPDIQEWIADIIVVGQRTNLPDPTSKYYRKVYLVRQGPRSYSEIAVCRFNKEDESYYWDLTEVGGYSKFDPNYFVDTADGVRLNVPYVVQEILNQPNVLEENLNNLIRKYYTKEEIDGFHYISDLNIITGTMDGTIRYYINDDMRTMSSDVRVAGLQRLAFLEYITEREIWDNAIHSQHVMNKAIITRHLEDRAVTPKKIACRPGYILANIDDESGTAHEIPIEEFMKQFGGGTGGSGCECEEMVEITEDEVKDIYAEEAGGLPPDGGSGGGSGCNCEELVEISPETVEDIYNDPNQGTE